MHSRIIEARDTKEDIGEGICEADFYDDSSVEEFSDYICDLEEEENPGDWLDRPGLRYDPEERTLTIVSKMDYFAAKHDEFLEALERLSTASLSDFSSGGLGADMWKLRDVYEDRYEVHLYGLDYYGNGLCTLDDWVRSMPDGTKVYIGNMLDYHW